MSSLNLDPLYARAKTHEDFCHSISRHVFDYYHDIYGSKLIFATIHGSYLYGTNHALSDLDLYVIVEEGRNKQRVNADRSDTALFNLDTFLRLVNDGSHQAVEALCSPYAVFNEDNHYSHMVRRLQPPTANYMRKALSAATAFKRSVSDDLVAQLKEDPRTTPHLTTTHHKKLHHAARLEAGAETVLHGGFSDYSPVWINT